MTGATEKTKNTQPSSHFARLKTRLRRKVHSKLATISEQLRLVYTQEVRNEAEEISEACADVCAAVSLAMRKVVISQGGASTTMAVTRHTAHGIIGSLGFFDRCMEHRMNHIITRYMIWPDEGPEFWRYSDMINFLLRDPDNKASSFATRVGYYAQISFADEQGKLTRTAIECARTATLFAVANVLTERIAVAEPTKAYVRFIGRLTSAVIAAGCQAARAVAATPHDPPPPYTPYRERVRSL